MQKGSYVCPYTTINLKGRLRFLMKCSFILMVFQLTLISVLTANGVRGQNLNQKVFLDIDGLSVKEGLLNIEKKSDVRFIIRDDLFNNLNKKIVLKAAQITVKEAITQMLAGTALDYKVAGGFITIVPRVIQMRINGKVIDALDKQTLPGVSVRLKALPLVL